MLSSLAFWIAVAVLLFWAVGAYNRLMRLRADLVQSFGGLDARWLRLMALQNECEAALAAQPGWEPGDITMALQAAATQFSASLAVMRARPMQADAAAALAAARDVLDASWRGFILQAAARLPDREPLDLLARRREAQHVELAHATEQFNAAVTRYNAAIGQFPALLVAALFGFRAARAL